MILLHCKHSGGTRRFRQSYVIFPEVLGLVRKRPGEHTLTHARTLSLVGRVNIHQERSMTKQSNIFRVPLMPTTVLVSNTCTSPESFMLTWDGRGHNKELYWRSRGCLMSMKRQRKSIRIYMDQITMLSVEVGRR